MTFEAFPGALGPITTVVTVLWSLWLLAAGVVLLSRATALMAPRSS